MPACCDLPIAFALVRVDDRLLHGQVALNWVRLLRPRRIALVDDDLAHNPDARALYGLALPDSITLWIGTLADAPQALLCDARHPPEETLVLLRSPAAAAALYAAGVCFTALNLGCLGASSGRVRVRRQLHLSREELTLLRALAARGVRVTAQAVPAEPPLTLEGVACRVLRAASA